MLNPQIESSPRHQSRGSNMSRFKKLTHVLWHCHYHIVWVPKYRFRILTGEVAREAQNCIQAFCSQLGCEVEQLNIQADHVHLLVKVPPKVSISNLMGTVKGRTAIRIFRRFPYLKRRPYWGNHFWAKGYCVDTVGLDADMIRTYVRYQEKAERRQQEMDLRG